MNLHICQDNPFLDNFIKNQKRFSPTENRYLVFSWNKNQIPRQITSKEIFFARWNSPEFWQFIGNPTEIHAIYFHYILPRFFNFTKHFPGKVVMIWIFWGGDGFGHPDIESEFLLPETRALYRKTSRTFPNRFRSPKLFIQFLLAGKRSRDWIKTMRRMDYFAHYIPEDFQLLRSRFGLQAKFLPFTYGYWKDYQGMEGYQNTPGKSYSGDILVGNSAGETNNHLDAFRIISTINLSSETRIICPLSYGQPNSAFLKKVVKKGFEIFGPRFFPLTDLLPLEDYNKIMGNCGIIILPHLRTQAFGNVLAALCMGKKILFFERNPLFRHLKMQGFRVFCFENDLSNTPLTPLSQEAHRSNLEKLEEFYGDSMMEEIYPYLLSIKT